MVSIDSAAMARLLSEINSGNPTRAPAEQECTTPKLCRTTNGGSVTGHCTVGLPADTAVQNRFLAMHKCTSCPYSVIHVKCKAFDIWLKVFRNAKVQVEEPSLPYFRSHYRTVAGGYSCEAGSLTSLQVFLAYVLCMYM